MPLRLYRAWCLYIRLNYSWHLAWHKAAHQRPFFVMRPATRAAPIGQALRKNDSSSFLRLEQYRPVCPPAQISHARKATIRRVSA